MKRINPKTALSKLFIALAFSSLVISCSNDDNTNKLPNGNTYKITVTLDNVEPTNDFVSIAIAGGNINGKLDVWKVNGVAKTGESAISLNDNSFSGAIKTYIIETTEPIQAFSGSVQIINFRENLPLSFKIEKNNEVIVNESQTLIGDGTDFTKQYSF